MSDDKTEQEELGTPNEDQAIEHEGSLTAEGSLGAEGSPKASGPVDSELQNIIEAALFAADEPIGIRRILSLFSEDAQPSKVDIQNVILSLQEQCEFRGIELRRIGNGWRFQSKEKYATWLRRLSANKAPRYSRAMLETLSIIAYRQPVTRGDIEEIRGVAVSSDTIRTLEERDWVAQIGHRDVPGRPALFGTTQGFLEYFSMSSLRELPELMDKRDLSQVAKDMNLTLPMDGVQDEDEAARQQEIEREQQLQAEINTQTDDPESNVVELRPGINNTADTQISMDVESLTNEQNNDSADTDDGEET